MIKSKVMKNLRKNLYEYHCRMDSDETTLEEFIESQIRAAIGEFVEMAKIMDLVEIADKGWMIPRSRELLDRVLAAFGVEE